MFPTPFELLFTILPALTLPVDTVKLDPVSAPPVIVPVVDTGFEPKAAKLATTLVLPYVAANPVNCEPLPMKKLLAFTVMLPLLAIPLLLRSKKSPKGSSWTLFPVVVLTINGKRLAILYSYYIFMH